MSPFFFGFYRSNVDIERFLRLDFYVILLFEMTNQFLINILEKSILNHLYFFDVISEFPCHSFQFIFLAKLI